MISFSPEKGPVHTKDNGLRTTKLPFRITELDVVQTDAYTRRVIAENSIKF